MDHLRHNTSVFKKRFHSFFFSHMPVLQRIKFTLLLGFDLEGRALCYILEETEQDHIRKTSVFLGIIYLWWQRCQNCLRLLEQTRISTCTIVVKVQRVFTDTFSSCNCSQQQGRSCPLCFWTIGSHLQSQKIETEKSEETIPGLG